MVYDPEHLPDDSEQLKAIIVSLQISWQQSSLESQNMIDKLTDEIRRLTALIEKFFNNSSEKLPKEKPVVETSENNATAPPRKKREKNGGGGRSALPQNLPRVEKVIDVPEAERTCSCCGELFKCIGEDLLFPLYALMQTKVLESFVLQVDATTAKFMDPLVKGKSRQGAVWGYNGDATRPYVLYDFLTHGKRDGPEAFLKDYQGYLQCDAHSVYDQIFAPRDAARPSPTEVGCWAHGRRKFFDAREVNKEAFDALGMIGDLYKLERKLKKSGAEERHSMRQQHAIPVLNDIFAWCREQQGKYLPKEPLTGAIQYALNHESALRRYCEDDRLEIDNNAAERILRLIAIGRKNWLFYGSERGGRTGAVLHSVLASAKRNGLNEFAYLCAVLDRLADLGSEAELNDLLPDQWRTE